MSPDLNPNKHTWNELERHVWGREDAPGNVHELFQTLKQEWVAFLAQVIYSLIQFIPLRCWAETDSRGHTPNDVHVTQSQHTEWLNFFLDERSVQIINFDQYQLKN